MIGSAGILCLLVYPIGIPCLYLVLAYNARRSLDPDPLFVVADVACDGKLTRHHICVNEEMRQLANSTTMIRGAAADVREKAIERHATKLAEQIEAHAPSVREDSHLDCTGRKVRWSSLAHEASTKVLDHLDRWENSKVLEPEEAAVVIQLEASATVVGAELVRQYRDANPSVQLLVFLVGAYEPCFYFWESIECARRLALTGLLVFFADGTKLQIIVASLIALASLYLYSKYRPYLDDRVDSLASMAQLMIFFQVSSQPKQPPYVWCDDAPFLFGQLFVALLLEDDFLQDYRWCKGAYITSILLVGNICVVFSDPVMFVGLWLFGLLDDNANQDLPARQASERKTASAECRVLVEDRKALIEQLRHDDNRKALLAAASKVARGDGDACLELLYQSRISAAEPPVELVALTISDDAAGSGVSDRPIARGTRIFVELAEDGGVATDDLDLKHLPMVSSTDADADKPEEHQQAGCFDPVAI